MLLLRQAAQPLFLVLDLALGNGDKFVPGVQRLANRLDLAGTQLPVVFSPEAFEDPPDCPIPVPQPAGVQHQLGPDAWR